MNVNNSNNGTVRFILKTKTTKHTLIDMEKDVQLLKQELESLQSIIFALDRFKADENISFYTGFPNFEAFYGHI